MSKVDDLLAAGVVINDLEKPERVIFNVPIYIPKAAIEMGGFEAFAKAYGWKGEVGEIPAHQKCTEIIWNFVRDVFKAQMINQAQEQAREAAQIQVQQLLG